MLTGSENEFEQALAHSTDDNGILRTAPNVFGQTAIHLAILHPSRLERLLKAGMDPDAMDRGGSTPLMYAACYGKSESVLCLLEHRARPWLVDHDNKRVFVDYAIRRNHIHVIEQVVHTLRRRGNNQGAMRVLDRSLRYYFVNGSSCHDVDGRRLKRLFALNADPDIHVGSSSLAHLARFDWEMHLLLTNGFTSVNSRNNEGGTPLMNAVSHFDIRSTKLLIERGTNVNCQDNRGWTGLHHLLRARLSCGLYTSPVEQCDETFRRRVAMIACMHLLLRSNADITIHDRCTCACSSNGCSATTAALHQTTAEIGSLLGPQVISGILIDLVCVLQNRMTPGVETILHDIIRYRRFLESGLEHSCCYQQHGGLSTQVDTDELRRAGHETFNNSLDNTKHRMAFDKDEIVMELAKIFQILEARALKAYNDEVEIEGAVSTIGARRHRSGTDRSSREAKVIPHGTRLTRRMIPSRKHSPCPCCHHCRKSRLTTIDSGSLALAV